MGLTVAGGVEMGLGKEEFTVKGEDNFTNRNDKVR